MVMKDEGMKVITITFNSHSDFSEQPESLQAQTIGVPDHAYNGW